jgi:hypothetical protein
LIDQIRRDLIIRQRFSLALLCFPDEVWDFLVPWQHLVIEEACSCHHASSFVFVFDDLSICTALAAKARTVA